MFKIKTLISIFFILQSCGCHHHTSKAKIKVENSSPQFIPTLQKDNFSPEIRKPLLLSKDFGETWMDVSQGLPDELQVSFIEKKQHELVLASDNLGVFLSSQNRTQWRSIGNDLPAKKLNALHVFEKIIYVGVYRKGIFKTIDEGKSWTPISSNLPNLNVHSICQLENKLVVGTDEGIFTLPKNATTWKATSVKSQVLSLYFHEGLLVAGTSQGTIISTDFGENWNWIRKEGAVHYTHNVGDRIIKLVLNGDLFYSDDRGKNWTESIYLPKSGSYIYEIIQVADQLLLSNNYGIHRSDDDAKTWNLIYPTESLTFFELYTFGEEVYGGTRAWDEYRKRKN